MEAELTGADGQAEPGLAARRPRRPRRSHVREQPCYGDDFGLYHTGAPGCDGAVTDVKAEKQTFTLNTSIMAVGEGNYGRLGPDQQQRFTTANRRLQLPDPDEQPGAMPEIAPSPDYAPRSVEGQEVHRARVGAAGVGLLRHGLAGRPPAARRAPGPRPRPARGRAAAAVERADRRLGHPPRPVGQRRRRARSTAGRTFTTTVTAHAPVRLRIGATLPADAHVDQVRLDGRKVSADERDTNRGLEVTVATSPGAKHTLVVTTR